MIQRKELFSFNIVQEAQEYLLVDLNAQHISLLFKNQEEVQTSYLSPIHGKPLYISFKFLSYNTIEIPQYESKEKLKAKLEYALESGMGVWGMG